MQAEQVYLLLFFQHRLEGCLPEVVCIMPLSAQQSSLTLSSRLPCILQNIWPATIAGQSQRCMLPKYRSFAHDSIHTWH